MTAPLNIVLGLVVSMIPTPEYILFNWVLYIELQIIICFRRSSETLFKILFSGVVS